MKLKRIFPFLCHFILKHRNRTETEAIVAAAASSTEKWGSCFRLKGFFIEKYVMKRVDNYCLQGSSSSRRLR